MTSLDELHRAYMNSKEPEENYNYDDHKSEIEDNEFTVWQPVGKNIKFEIMMKGKINAR